MHHNVKLKTILQWNIWIILLALQGCQNSYHNIWTYSCISRTELVVSQIHVFIFFLSCHFFKELRVTYTELRPGAPPPPPRYFSPRTTASGSQGGRLVQDYPRNFMPEWGFELNPGVAKSEHCTTQVLQL